MTDTEAKALAEAMAPAIKEFVRRQIEPLQKRIDELEARPILKYCGVWEPGREYLPGEFVTQTGSVWHCQRETIAQPGAGDSWLLAVKRGANARDAS